MIENHNNFKNNRYLLIKSMVPSDICKIATKYALLQEEVDFTPEDDEHAQVRGSHSRYSDLLMETLQFFLLPKMEKATGLSLFPTYTYYRIYRPGHELTRHKDRPSCEISATLCFNFNYDAGNVWSIYMGGNRVDLLPGDLAIYRGCDVPHWREPFDKGQDAWQVQAFFHYVDAHGPNAEWKWDKRASLGMLGTSPSLELLKEYKASTKPSDAVAEKSYIQYTK